MSTLCGHFLNVPSSKVWDTLRVGIEACLRFFIVSERLKNPNTDTGHVMTDKCIHGPTAPACPSLEGKERFPTFFL